MYINIYIYIERERERMEQRGVVNNNRSNSERSGEGRMVDAMNRWMQRMGEDVVRTGLYPMWMYVCPLLVGLFSFGAVGYSIIEYIHNIKHPDYVGQPVVSWIVGLSFLLLLLFFYNLYGIYLICLKRYRSRPLVEPQIN